MTDGADAIPNRGYHAHIYYDPAKTRPTAERLCAVIGEKFKVEFGGFRDGPVGPHPVANAQVIFKPDQFQPIVEWLMLHRDGLDVLIHPLTDDSVDDHSIYAMWLGSPGPLKVRGFAGRCRAELLPSAGAAANRRVFGAKAAEAALSTPSSWARSRTSGRGPARRRTRAASACGPGRRAGFRWRARRRPRPRRPGRTRRHDRR